MQSGSWPGIERVCMRCDAAGYILGCCRESFSNFCRSINGHIAEFQVSCHRHRLSFAGPSGGVGRSTHVSLSIPAMRVKQVGSFWWGTQKAALPRFSQCPAVGSWLELSGFEMAKSERPIDPTATKNHLGENQQVGASRGRVLFWGGIRASPVQFGDIIGGMPPWLPYASVRRASKGAWD